MRKTWQPAAFRRLCVETRSYKLPCRRDKLQPPLGGCVLKLVDLFAPCAFLDQPPLGGCVLKLFRRHGRGRRNGNQPPLGGCVLKQAHGKREGARASQPPLGGCVLKPVFGGIGLLQLVPAAFRRLCVETKH